MWYCTGVSWKTCTARFSLFCQWMRLSQGSGQEREAKSHRQRARYRAWLQSCDRFASIGGCPSCGQTWIRGVATCNQLCKPVEWLAHVFLFVSLCLCFTALSSTGGPRVVAVFFHTGLLRFILLGITRVWDRCAKTSFLQLFPLPQLFGEKVRFSESCHVWHPQDCFNCLPKELQTADVKAQFLQRAALMLGQNSFRC